MQSTLNAATPGALTEGAPAGFLIRAAALFIDQMLLMVGGGLLGGMFGFVMGANGAPEGVITLGGFLIGIGLGISYYWGMVAVYGATLGKQWLGLRIVCQDGSPLSVWQALGRYVCVGISALPLGIGLFMAGFRSDKRALHDLMIGSKVIRVAKP